MLHHLLVLTAVLTSNIVCLEDPKDTTPMLMLDKVKKLRWFLKKDILYFPLWSCWFTLLPLPIYHPLSVLLLTNVKWLLPFQDLTVLPFSGTSTTFLSAWLPTHKTILKTPLFSQVFQPQRESGCGFTPQRYPLHTWQFWEPVRQTIRLAY